MSEIPADLVRLARVVVVSQESLDVRGIPAGKLSSERQSRSAVHDRFHKPRNSFAVFNANVLGEHHDHIGRQVPPTAFSSAPVVEGAAGDGLNLNLSCPCDFKGDVV